MDMDQLYSKLVVRFTENLGAVFPTFAIFFTCESIDGHYTRFLVIDFAFEICT